MKFQDRFQPRSHLGPDSQTLTNHESIKGAAQMTSEKPILYALSTCSHCKSTKKLLNDCNVEYHYVEVDDLEGEERKAIIQDIKALNPRCSFPTIKINDIVIVGYKEKEIKKALGIH
jgi:glutaredoxin-like protein NrdH